MRCIQAVREAKTHRGASTGEVGGGGRRPIISLNEKEGKVRGRKRAKVKGRNSKRATSENREDEFASAERWKAPVDGGGTGEAS